MPIKLRYILVLVLVLACRRHDPARQLVLSGSSTIAPVAGELARRFEATHPGVRVDVQSGGSSRGIADARKGLVQIGMVSRALTADERDLTAHTFAHDGIAMIVHRDNPVLAFTRAQLIEIYRGTATDWSVGGGHGRIVVVNKAEGRSTLELFLAFTGLHAADIRADVIAGENEQVIKTVAGNPAALGYVSIGSAEGAIAAGTPIRLVAIDGHAATRAAVAAGTAPMTRPLNFVTRGPPSELAAAFLAFAATDEAQALIERAGFVPIAPRPM